jgi:membrane protein DedA with SNARE-associated domain/rhodanese-related sulfurtransferase
LSDQYASWVLGLNTFLHEIGIPIPLVPTALLAGAQVTEGEANAITLVLVMVASTLLANSFWFAAGRSFGGRVLKVLCRISLSQDACVARTESAFTKWGVWSLLFSHFVPGISLVVPPLAGAFGMRWSIFLGLTAVGAVIYSVVLIGAGMLLSREILGLADIVLANSTESIGIVFLLCAAYAGWKLWRRRAAARALQVPRISVAELKAALEGPTPPTVVDLRGEAMHRADARRIPGALSTTPGDVVRFVEGRAISAPIVLYCACPNDASAAAGVRALTLAGYTRVSALAGGLDAWFAGADSSRG